MTAKTSGPGLAIWQIAQRMKPLAEFQRANKPAVTTMRVFPSDLALLLAHPALARQYGFSVEEGKVRFQGFELLATADGGRKLC